MTLPIDKVDGHELSNKVCHSDLAKKMKLKPYLP